jgi:hypothetical protein
MKVELELNESLVQFYEAYSKATKQTLDESVRQVLADFAFGAIELGFQEHSKESERPTQ